MRLSPWFAALTFLALLSSIAVAGRRKNPRDFPEGWCPIHQGWEVNLVGEVGVPDPASQPRIHEDLRFIAAGPAAVITFLACDRTSSISDNLSDFDFIGGRVDVRIDDVAVVREKTFISHQTATVPRATGCYFGFEPFPALSVGSIFDRLARPHITPFTQNLPFFDDFSNVNASRRRWRLGGADVDPIEGNLILARQQQPDGKVSCSSASFRAAGLVKGQSYVVDYRWLVVGIGTAGEPAMLTYIDVGPGI